MVADTLAKGERNVPTLVSRSKFLHNGYNLSVYIFIF
jgi:hypothetical protein